MFMGLSETTCVRRVGQFLSEPPAAADGLFWARVSFQIERPMMLKTWRLRQGGRLVSGADTQNKKPARK
jgi:hypothetical protein